MLDRRFLDFKFTIKGYAATEPESPEYGDQYIVSSPWSGESDAKENCIATYIQRGEYEGWEFTIPNGVTTPELINLATGDVLRYKGEYPDGSWETIGNLGGSGGGGSADTSGLLLTESHTITATEVSNEELTLTTPALANSASSLVCFLAGGVHVAGRDFSVTQNSSTGIIKVAWDDYTYFWNTSAPRVGEVAIFMLKKA